MENFGGTNLMTEMYQNALWMMMRLLLINFLFFVVLSCVVFISESHSRCFVNFICKNH